MSTSSAASDAAVEAIVVEFGLWLARERGLSAAAMCCYGKQARKFLCWLPDRVDSAVRQLDSTQVTSFMVSYCQDRNISSAKATVVLHRGRLGHGHPSNLGRSRTETCTVFRNSCRVLRRIRGSVARCRCYTEGVSARAAVNSVDAGGPISHE